MASQREPTELSCGQNCFSVPGDVPPSQDDKETSPTSNYLCNDPNHMKEVAQVLATIAKQGNPTMQRRGSKMEVLFVTPKWSSLYTKTMVLLKAEDDSLCAGWDIEYNHRGLHDVLVFDKISKPTDVDGIRQALNYQRYEDACQRGDLVVGKRVLAYHRG